MTAHPTAKPTMGFDTKRAAIAHLHGRGLPTAAIAHEVGGTINSVEVSLCRMRLRPHRPCASVGGPRRPPFIELSADLVPMLKPHAARRSLSCAALAARIVDTVVTHSLIEAVLDGREG